MLACIWLGFIHGGLNCLVLAVGIRSRVELRLFHFLFMFCLFSSFPTSWCLLVGVYFWCIFVAFIFARFTLCFRSSCLQHGGYLCVAF